jgi:FkbM family methyltransferase
MTRGRQETARHQVAPTFLRSLIKRIPPLHAAGRAWNQYCWLKRAQQLHTYAQNGEDRALLELFPTDYKGTYVDLGANHPYRISNTYLLYTRGWHGLCVEPIPTFAPRYQRHRPRDRFVNAGVGLQAGEFPFFEMSIAELSTFSQEIAEELVASGRAAIKSSHRIAMQPVSTLVAELFPDGLFDVLSVDVEGLDAEIVRGTDWDFVRPRAVICETSCFEHDWAAEIIGLFSDRGYRHERRIGCNDLFINTAAGRTVRTS